jgi:hypothetical protein
MLLVGARVVAVIVGISLISKQHRKFKSLVGVVVVAGFHNS